MPGFPKELKIYEVLPKKATFFFNDTLFLVSTFLKSAFHRPVEICARVLHFFKGLNSFNITEQRMSFACFRQANITCVPLWFHHILSTTFNLDSQVTSGKELDQDSVKKKNLNNPQLFLF